jgi:hypothetical protein
MSGIRCGGCGLEHGDGAALSKVGWKADGRGGALLRATCGGCGCGVTIDEIADATLCTACHRLVLGCDGDVKIATEARGVLCIPCARRSEYTIQRPLAAGGRRDRCC